MRALTLCQPYASAIVHGPKRTENRPWPVPRTVPLPAWIAVHAGTRDWPAEPVRALWSACPPRVELSRRAVLGAMRVYDCVEGTLPDDPWAFGPYCWVIGAVVALPEPIPILRGHLGLWHLDKVCPEADRTLRELVGRADG